MEIEASALAVPARLGASCSMLTGDVAHAHGQLAEGGATSINSPVLARPLELDGRRVCGPGARPQMRVPGRRRQPRPGPWVGCSLIAVAAALVVDLLRVAGSGGGLDALVTSSAVVAALASRPGSEHAAWWLTRDVARVLGERCSGSAAIAAAALAVAVTRSCRGMDLHRIVAEYAAAALGALGTPGSSFTDADRRWVCRHAATSFDEIEKATLRLVALRTSANVSLAAAGSR